MEDHHLLHLVSHREDRVERTHGFLKNHGNVVASNLPQSLSAHLQDVFAFEEDFSPMIFPGGSAMRRKIERARTDLPQPVSPTKPMISPRWIVRSTFFKRPHHPLVGEEPDGKVFHLKESSSMDHLRISGVKDISKGISEDIEPDDRHQNEQSRESGIPPLVHEEFTTHAHHGTPFPV